MLTTASCSLTSVTGLCKLSSITVSQFGTPFRLFLVRVQHGNSETHTSLNITQPHSLNEYLCECNTYIKTYADIRTRTRIFDLRISLLPCQLVSRAIAQAVSCRFRSQVSPCGICGGQSDDGQSPRNNFADTGTGLSPSPSVSPCQYHSTATPYSLMCHLGEGQRAR
jgi:hypothetical protein